MARKNLRNSLQEKLVVADGATSSYNPAVKNDEIWRAVGRSLAARREFLGWPTPGALRRDHPQAPDVRMLADIERGVPRTVTLLAKYCDVLGVSLSVVLADVLAPCDVTPLALQVARAFDEMPLPARVAVLPVLKQLRDTAPTASPLAGPLDAAAPTPPTPSPRTPKPPARRR